TREDRFDAGDLVVLHLEQLGDLPGPGLYRTRGDRAAVGCLERARVAAGMVEEHEREHDAAFLVHGNEAAVADAMHEVDQARLELLEAAPLAGIPGSRFRIRTRFTFRGRIVRGGHAVLDAVAVCGERVVTLAVVLLHAGKVLVRGFDHRRARHA